MTDNVCLWKQYEKVARLDCKTSYKYARDTIPSATQRSKVSNRELELGKKRIQDYISKRTYGTVSYSLYGSDPRYIDGIIENAELMPKIYPGWKMRVYYGKDVPEKTLGFGNI